MLKFPRKGLFLALLLSGSCVQASPTDDIEDRYWHGPVYELIGDDQACSLSDDGMAVDLWGNSGDYSDEQTEVILNGKGLRRYASYKGQSPTSYYFFKSKAVCEQQVRVGLRTGVLLGHNDSTPQPTQQSNQPAKKTWYIANLNHRKCISNGSPADKIREYQSNGVKARIDDLPGGAVGVGDDDTVFTYYPTLQMCQDALPSSQQVDAKYE